MTLNFSRKFSWGLIMEIGHKIRLTKGPNKGHEGIVLNPRDVYGWFEGGSMPVQLEGIEEAVTVHPSEAIRIPRGYHGRR
jgi:hypothetical protein